MPPKENDKLTDAQIAHRSGSGSRAARRGPMTSGSRNCPTTPDAGKWEASDGVIVKTSGGLSPDWTSRKYKPENLWAYQPLTQPKIPAAKDEGGRMKSEGNPDSSFIPHPSSFSSNPIDAFLGAKMRELGVTPAPRADRRTLIRRATYDLHGLPPTPEEVEAFVEGLRLPTTKAFAKVVERLLASPHYGEQWGRHWLDVVRYADSSGFANDYERGNAWRYRDYVIRAFNADKPYDQFIREQIAGDEIAAERMKDEGGRMKPAAPIQNFTFILQPTFGASHRHRLPPHGAVGTHRHGGGEGRAAALPRRRDRHRRPDLPLRTRCNAAAATITSSIPCRRATTIPSRRASRRRSLSSGPRRSCPQENVSRL